MAILGTDLDGLAVPTTPAGRKVMSELGDEAVQVLLPVLMRHGAAAAQLGDDAPAPIALVAILLVDLSTLGQAWGVDPREAIAAALGIVSAGSAEDAHAVLRAALELRPARVWPFGKPPERCV